MTVQLKRNDTKDTISYTVTNLDGSVVNLTGATVKFVMGKNKTLITNAAATIVSAAAGQVSYTLTETDTLVAGTFNAEFEVTFSDGKVKSYPTNGYLFVNIQANVDKDKSTYIEDNIAYRVSDIQLLKNEVQAKLEDFETRLENGGGGGGSESGVMVYNTLSELQTAYPGGVSQPVWIMSENAWYYWNGTITNPSDRTAPVLTITAGGTFTGTKSVTMSTNETATIYYTDDGSDPKTSGTKKTYISQLSLTATTTIKAYAKDTAGNESNVQTVTYTYSATPPADTTPPVLTITPAATFTDTQTVTMSTNETATIWYTLDDSDPKTSGTRLQYTSPLTLTETDTVKAYAVDSSNNESAVQTVTYTKQAAISDAYALNFNGTDSIATSANNMGITGAQPRTIEVRFKTNNLAVNQTILEWGTTTGVQANSLVIHNQKFMMRDGTNFVDSYANTITALENNKWYHLVFTYDGTTQNWYLDGTKKRGPENYPSVMATVSNPMKLGSGISGKLNGAIDFIRVYNKALTQAEITNNKNGSVTRDGLLNEWLISEGTGTAIADTAGTNNLTASNSTWVSNA